MSDTTAAKDQVIEIESCVSRTLFGISYKKIGIGIGIGIAGYLAYRAYVSKSMQKIIDPIVHPVAEEAISGIVKKMF